MSVMHIDSIEEFHCEVLDSDGLVLVDFWAEWCGPCRMMAPVLEEFAAAYPHVRVVKVNVDVLQQPAISLGIDSIPAFLLFENGKLRQRTVGAMPMNQLAKQLGL